MSGPDLPHSTGHMLWRLNRTGYIRIEVLAARAGGFRRGVPDRKSSLLHVVVGTVGPAADCPDRFTVPVSQIDRGVGPDATTRRGFWAMCQQSELHARRDSRNCRIPCSARSTHLDVAISEPVRPMDLAIPCVGAGEADPGGCLSIATALESRRARCATKLILHFATSIPCGWLPVNFNPSRHRCRLLKRGRIGTTTKSPWRR